MMIAGVAIILKQKKACFSLGMPDKYKDCT
jgi:hypothetical protein